MTLGPRPFLFYFVTCWGVSGRAVVSPLKLKRQLPASPGHILILSPPTFMSHVEEVRDAGCEWRRDRWMYRSQCWSRGDGDSLCGGAFPCRAPLTTALAGSLRVDTVLQAQASRLIVSRTLCHSATDSPTSWPGGAVPALVPTLPNCHPRVTIMPWRPRGLKPGLVCTPEWSE